MTWLGLLFALSAAGALIGIGYLLGTQRGRAQPRLQHRCEALNRQVQYLENQLSSRNWDQQNADSWTQTIINAVACQEQAIDGLCREVRALPERSAEQQAAEREYETRIAGLLDRLHKATSQFGITAQAVEQHLAASTAQGQEMATLLQSLPSAHSDSRTNRLAQIGSQDIDLGATRALPGILDSIAEQGRFSEVILSDELGLPLANSRGAYDVELRAGLSTLLLNLSDRIAGTGALPLRAVVLRDQSEQSILHRILQIAGDRYVLTVVTTDETLSPDTLDPVLPVIERVLSLEDLAETRQASW